MARRCHREPVPFDSQLREVWSDVLPNRQISRPSVLLPTILPSMRQKYSTLLLALFSFLVITARAAMPPSNVQIYRQIVFSFGQGPVTIVEGDFVWFTLSASGDYPRFQQWRKDGQPIRGATNSWYHIDTARPTDAGTFSVTVTNAAGSGTSADTVVSVVALPAIQQTPPIGLVGGTVALNALVPGGVGLTGAQWYFEDQAIPGATNLSYTRANLRLVDDGQYRFRCAYTSLNRVVDSRGFHSKVYSGFSAPLVVTQPKNQIGRSGGVAVFTVGASGTPPFSYQWSKNGSLVPLATNFFLALTNLQSTDAAAYSVRVQNSSGWTNSLSAALTLGTAPPTQCHRR